MLWDYAHTKIIKITLSDTTTPLFSFFRTRQRSLDPSYKKGPLARSNESHIYLAKRWKIRRTSDFVGKQMAGSFWKHYSSQKIHVIKQRVKVRWLKGPSLVDCQRNNLVTCLGDNRIERRVAFQRHMLPLCPLKTGLCVCDHLPTITSCTTYLRLLLDSNHPAASGTHIWVEWVLQQRGRKYSKFVADIAEVCVLYTIGKQTWVDGCY